MKALEKDVLKTALEIQDTLLGPTIDFNPRSKSIDEDPADPTLTLTPHMRDSFHAVNGLTNSSWFFHSPLQYWFCSIDNILQDQDIVTTVNRASRQSTSVNVTLRHSIVFSGKRFEDHRLVAADSLVITLVHMLDSPVGAQWERKARELSSRNSEIWHIHQDNAPESTLYEFQFRPLTGMEHFQLAIAYTIMTWYFLIQLSKLHALKSRLGLVFTVLMQLLFSTISSFVICAILKIDLSKLPREAYPLVIVPTGLGNIFDFINAVVATSARWTPSHRIGEAIGLQGPIMLATVAEYLLFLWFLPRVTGSYYHSPVMAFCRFASLALVFNFFFMMTLLVPVISVDIQRAELNDSLTRASGNSSSSSAVDQPRKSWISAMLLWRKGIPISTRIAGQVVLIGSIIIFQWHFQDVMLAMSKSFPSMKTQATQLSTPSNSASLLSVDIHQARSPTAWLRMQDHETARELIQVIKPHAHSYIARVYKPLTFILNGSDRTPNQFGVRPFLPAAYDFTRNHLKLFLLTIVVMVAAVAVLMNYLLWDELPEIDDEEFHEDHPLLSVITLDKGHELDIMHLVASRDGIVATVGLDRRIQIWDVRGGVTSYMVQEMSDQVDPFPILAICIDSDSNWLAFLSAKDMIFLWNIPERKWGPTMEVQVRRRKPVAFFFGYGKEELIDPVVIVRQNGLMSELHVESKMQKELRICHSPLVSVRRHYERPNSTSNSPPPRIITSSKKGCVHVASCLAQEWISDGLEIPDPADDPDILCVLPLPVLSAFLAVRDHTVDLIDIISQKVTHTFTTKSMKQGSLRCFHSTRRRPQCGSVGLANLTLAYTCAETGSCIVHTYLPEREGDTICFRDPYTPGSKTCCLWRETVESRYEVMNPGKWEALPVGYIVGIRKQDSVVEPLQNSTAQSSHGPGLRRRGQQNQAGPIARQEDMYEVWSLSARGERSTCPFFGPYERQRLFNSTLGDIEKLGNRTIVVSLGDVAKVITVGNEKFDGAGHENEDDVFVGMTPIPSRRKKSAPHRSKKTA